jgi:ureidoglycolate lyase
MEAQATAATRRRLELVPATPESVAPFGQILGRTAALRPIGVSYYAGVATSRPVDYVCRGETELSLSSLEPRPGQVRYLERHFQHTQTFVPLLGKPFVVVMAPPGRAAMPDLDAVRALHFDGSAGLLMHVGTWHEFPFAIEPATDLVVVLSAQTGADLKNKTEGHEASGPDLQKLDIARRTGVVFEFDLPAPARR